MEMKFFSKKQFFAFLASFFATIICGFFIWSAFLNSNNYTFIFSKVLGQVNEIGYKIFPAVVSLPDPSVIASPVQQDEAISNSEDATTDEIASSPEAPRNDELAGEAKPAVAESSGEAKQDLLDDLAEKLDIIQQQVDELVKEKNDKQEIAEAPNADETQKKENQEEKITDNTKDNTNGIKPDFPKILISEIGAGGNDDDKQEMVELYNPNNFDIDLTGWYLQRKTSSGASWSTYASTNLFSGKTISANGYFLIARSGYYIGAVDIFVTNPITNDNSFVLKNSGGDISDEVGFGNCSDSETFCAPNPAGGQSIGRKWDENLKTYQDTNNNLEDFQANNLTPSWPNKIYDALLDVATSFGGGGSENATADYSKILISEVQISPIENRFIELYNPNNSDINLDNWYLQRKTATGDDYSSFVTKNDFAGKKILANSYFLISRQIENSDILQDITLSDDNFLVLKNPDKDISDIMSTASPSDSQSFCLLDIWQVCAPTPKAQNVAYTDPPSEPPPTELAPPTDPIPPPVAGATQLKIITSPQIVEINIFSGIFTVESQDANEQLSNVLATTHVNLSSDSTTGLFASASATTKLCGDEWASTKSITIAKNSAHKSFCFKDSAAGTYLITVSADGLSSDSQTITVNAPPNFDSGDYFQDSGDYSQQ